MAKSGIIIFFLSCFSASIWIFVSRDKSSLRENIEKAPANTDPRLVLEDFTLRKYWNGQQRNQMDGAFAAFFAPNIAELEENIDAWQLRQGKQQKLSSRRATIYFNSSNLTDLLGKAEIESAKMSGFVQIDYDDYTLFTDEANYIGSEKKIYGNLPLRVAGPGTWFAGINGFRLFLDEELLDVYGKVRGMVHTKR